MELKMFEPGLTSTGGANANTNAIAATTASTYRAVPDAIGSDYVVYNDGPSIGAVAFSTAAGSSAIMPTVSGASGAAGDTIIPVGQSIPFSFNRPMTHWAGVSAGTCSLYVTKGQGN